MLFGTYKFYCYHSYYWATVSNEYANLEKSFEQLQAVTSLNNLPLLVLVQGAKAPEMSDEEFHRWHELPLDLTKLSSNSQYIIVENSEHLILLEQLDLILSAVRQLVERA